MRGSRAQEITGEGRGEGRCTMYGWNGSKRVGGARDPCVMRAVALVGW